MIQRIFYGYSVNSKVFKQRFKPLAFYTYLLFRRFLVETGFMLDKLFYSGRMKKVRKVVVITGNPRSGTTFLHRTLNDLGIGCGTEVKHMLFPSIVLQKLFAPLFKRAPMLNNFSNIAHSTGPDEVDCDDAAILAQYFDGFFAGPVLNAWHKHRSNGQIFYPDSKAKSKRDFRYMHKVWSRNLTIAKKDTVLAKFFSLGNRMEEFNEAFPQSKMIYLLRDPLQAIPSGISLMTIVLENSFEFLKLPENEKQAFYLKAYKGYVVLYTNFFTNASKLSNEKLHVVLYDELTQNPKNSLYEIFMFLNIDPSDEQMKKIKLLEEKQKSYKSKHEYSGQKFGITQEMIKKDCAMVFEYMEKIKNKELFSVISN